MIDVRQDTAIQKALLAISTLAVAEAARLARSGRLDAAYSALDDLPEQVATVPVVLDLRARISAQQGRLEEANALWSEASKLNPGNVLYVAALKRVAALQGSRVPFLTYRLLTTLSLGLLCIALTVFSVTRYISNWRVDERVPISRTPPLPASPAQTMLDDDVPPDIKIDLPGISTHTEGHQLIVTFQSALFSFGTRLKPNAHKLLHSVGRQLSTYSGRVSVVVVGHTDNLPVRPGRRYRDNAQLGLLRAAAVAEHINRHARIPAEMLYTQSLEVEASPYINDTPQGRMNNRTASIRIAKSIK